MCDLKHILHNNREWAAQTVKDNPEFFSALSAQQNPDILWIGCSDSRVPANEIMRMDPGEVFVQRNVANQVQHSDLNCMSVMQYAVDVLKVEHIIVCGHYNCGGVAAALTNDAYGLVDNWIRPIKDLYVDHIKELDILNDEAKLRRLCELNVLRQVRQVVNSKVVQRAWAKEQKLSVHGWIYGLEDGILHDLEVTASKADAAHKVYNVLVDKEPEI